jgi:competence protein ComEA
MNYLLQKLIFTLTLAISVTLVTSVSYAKDELDTTSKTSTTKDSKAKESKEKKSSDTKSTTKDSKAKESKEKKSSDTKSTTQDSKAKDSKVNSADKLTKDSKKTDSTTSKKVNDTKSSTKVDKSSSKSLQPSTTTSRKKATTPTSTGKKQYKDEVVNLNKAGVDAFSHYLMGIGKVKAEAIVAYRKQNGKFKTVDDLLKVEGIGEKIFAGLKKNISLTTGKTSVSQADKSGTTKAK